MNDLDQYTFNAGKWAGKVESLAADVERQYQEITLEFKRYMSDEVEDGHEQETTAQQLGTEAEQGLAAEPD